VRSAATRIAVDVGGTFVDALALDGEGGLRWAKVPNPGGDPRAAIAAAIARVTPHDARVTTLLHSTTLATNALLEGNLPAIGLIVTRGFREILGVGGSRGVEADSQPGEPGRNGKPIVPLELVQEVDERIAADGSVCRGLNEQTVRRAAREFRTGGIATIAVSLLHSYANPAHELRVKQILSEEMAGAQVLLSCEISRRAAEYARTAATSANAALKSVMAAYLADLTHRGALENRGALSSDAPLMVMQASGGLTSARGALERPLDTALSGSSAAVVGAAWLGSLVGYGDLVTLDMGGTSADIGLIERHEFEAKAVRSVAGYPLFSAAVDVRSIATGGGSIAGWSSTGGLCVGPRSAGAMPGPACYETGGIEATVTDAHLMLGRLPEVLAGGTLLLSSAAAKAALNRLAKARGLDPRRVACGIIEIASQQLCSAIRRMLALAGVEASRFVLMAMGGAAGLHAAHLAILLGMDQVLVPPKPGLAAALGLLAADFQTIRGCIVMEPMGEANLPLVERTLAELEREVSAELDRERVPDQRRQLDRSADFRFAGLATELTIPLADRSDTGLALAEATARFRERFAARFGFSRPTDHEVELVALRVSGRGLIPRPRLPEIVTLSQARPRAVRDVHFVETGTSCPCPIYAAEDLGSGSRTPGPAIIEQQDATLVVPPGWQGRMDRVGLLALSREPKPRI
jgi:N-methylhydantoinase A